ncbi:hypothetical protein JR316_0012192 [Psilocybe cubensis]|uniref:Uncharacterized protein n=2 Tax=Psilocybe cubensis TaxID=181762 RepID=A0ACB8GHF0_PSICU|nr:hypothetical protein JR316_0012192 [Psilocybe cubensis]KAH9475086.1 hypothetical protein JR316_0012192 [Psilocybe cubensis]
MSGHLALPAFHTNQLTEENTMLQEKVTQLQRQLALAELLEEEDTKPKKPQRKKGNSQKSGAASVGGSSTPSDPLALLTETVANLQKAMTEEREKMANLRKAMTEEREAMTEECEKVANLQKAMTEEREALTEECEKVANLQKAMMTEEREARQKVEATLANLQKAMTEEREKVANLQKAMTEEREAWQKVEATLASERDERLWQLSEVAGRTGELEQWAVTADPEILDRIRLRSLLDEGQAKLARFAGLVSEKDTTSYASMTWRLKLKGEDGEPAADDARLRTARSLLTGRGGIIPQAIQVLVDNKDAMRLLTETKSSIRNWGNHFAHHLASKPAEDKKGMLGILEFVSGSSM